MATDTADRIVLQDATGLDLELEVAGVGSRSYAFLIDWHIRVLLALVWGAVYWALAAQGGLAGMNETGRLLLGGGPIAVLYFLYHPILEIGWSGWTPGRQFAGVKIVGTDGHPAPAGAHLVRNVFRLVDSLPALYALGLTVALFHPRQLRIGDLAAGTVLVFEGRHRQQALDEARAGLRSEHLTPAQHELALDLLARWGQLSRNRRVVFGERFLTGIGEKPPQGAARVERERAIEQRLRALTADDDG